MRINLKSTDEIERFETEVSFKSEQWEDVCDRFLSFLQGCGYNLKGEDLANYFSEQYLFSRGKSLEE